MSQILLCSGENFAGLLYASQNDVPDYQSVSTVHEVRSLKINTGIWIVYSESNYKGTFAVYKAGKYPSDLKIKRIRSIRKLSGELDNPEITVFGERNNQGSEGELKDNEHPSVPFPIMSFRVGNGVWILYDNAGFNGNSIVGITGDHVPNVTGKSLNGSVKSLRAHLTYET